jgi:hypothetical protein
LVLTIMVATLVGMAATGAHAAPAVLRPHISHNAVLALKKAGKSSSSCKTSNNVYTIPCTVTEDSSFGGISFTLQGQKLAKSTVLHPQQYVLYSPLVNACATTAVYQDGTNIGDLSGSAATGAVVTTDYNGRFNVTVTATDCSAATYTIVAQWTSDFSKTYTTSIKVKAP